MNVIQTPRTPPPTLIVRGCPVNRNAVLNRIYIYRLPSIESHKFAVDKQWRYVGIRLYMRIGPFRCSRHT